MSRRHTTTRGIAAALGLLVAGATQARAAGPAAAPPAPHTAPAPAPRPRVAPTRPALVPKAPPSHGAPTASRAPAARARPLLWNERDTFPSTPAAEPGPLLPVHALGAFLGKGTFKKVYVAAGAPDAVVRVMQPEEDGKVDAFGEWIEAGEFLDKEHRLLRKLEQHGFPVVRVLAKGEIRGLPADVVERYDFSDRDKELFARNGKAVLGTAVPDLRRIRRALETSGLAILDIQVLMKRGHVVIADPMDVVPRAENPRAYEGNLKFVDDLLAQAGAAPN